MNQLTVEPILGFSANLCSSTSFSWGYILKMCMGMGISMGMVFLLEFYRNKNSVWATNGNGNTED